jgi:hypothetical protein
MVLAEVDVDAVLRELFTLGTPLLTASGIALAWIELGSLFEFWAIDCCCCSCSSGC